MKLKSCSEETAFPVLDPYILTGEVNVAEPADFK